MAFTAGLSRIATNEDGSKVFIKDITGDFGDVAYIQQEDGTYEQTTNDTGYGIDNGVEKDDYARLVYAVYHGVGDKNEVIFPEAYLADEVSVDEYIFPVPYDGYYTYHMKLIPLISGATPSVGDAVFVADFGTGPYNGDILQWENGQWATVDINTINELAAFNVIDSQILNDGWMANLIRAYNALNAKLKEWELGNFALDRAEASRVMDRMTVILAAFHNAWALYHYDDLKVIASKNDHLIKLANAI